MTRGVVLPLSLSQIAMRAKYLGQLVGSDSLDSFVRNPKPQCADGYYLLRGMNGGKDPTAPDPFDRWSNGWSNFQNRTADCSGGASWCGGFDRYQPKRFAHIYDGWINTDSMLLDAFGPARCFEVCDRPLPGCFVVAPSGSEGFAIGHVATVYAVPPEWDADVEECWKHVLCVDVAARTPNAANRPQANGAGAWFHARGASPKHAAFVRSVMTP